MLCVALLLAGSLSSGAAGQSSQRVAFARGASKAAIAGSITGRQYRDYLIGAREGQRMSVSMTTRGNAYFNILPPGSDVAIYNASSDGTEASGIVLPTDGDYRVRVYAMGAAMRSMRPVSYRLSIGVR